MAFTAAAVASNPYLTGALNPPYPSGSEVVSVRFYMDLATGDLALNSIGKIGILPAGCLPVEVRVDGADIDSGAAAAVFQIGVGNAALRDAAGAVSADAADTLISTVAADGGGAWGDTSTAVATAFDKLLTRTLNNMAKVTRSDVDRSIVLKVTTAPSTAVAGRIGVTLSYKSA